MWWLTWQKQIKIFQEKKIFSWSMRIKVSQNPQASISSGRLSREKDHQIAVYKAQFKRYRVITIKQIMIKRQEIIHLFRHNQHIRSMLSLLEQIRMMWSIISIITQQFRIKLRADKYRRKLMLDRSTISINSTRGKNLIKIKRINHQIRVEIVKLSKRTLSQWQEELNLPKIL